LGQSRGSKVLSGTTRGSPRHTKASVVLVSSRSSPESSGMVPSADTISIYGGERRCRSALPFSGVMSSGDDRVGVALGQESAVGISQSLAVGVVSDEQGFFRSAYPCEEDSVLPGDAPSGSSSPGPAERVASPMSVDAEPRGSVNAPVGRQSTSPSQVGSGVDDPVPPSDSDPVGEVTSCFSVHSGRPHSSIFQVMDHRKHAMMAVGSLADQEVSIGLDTMAQGSFIDEELIRMFPDLFPPVQALPSPLSTTSAHQTSVMATGYVDLTFCLGEHSFTHPVVVVPQFGKLFLLGIDFLERHHWAKPQGHSHIILDGHKRVDYIPNPLCFEDDGVKAVLRRERHIRPHEICYMVAYLQGTPERALPSVRVGEEGYLRQDGSSTAKFKGLHVWEERVVVEQGQRVVVGLENTTAEPITIPRDTAVAVYSQHTLEALLVHHDDIPTGVVPDEDFIKHLQTMQLSPTQVEDVLKVLFNRRQAFAMHPRKPGLNRLVEHVIDTGDHPPIRCRPHFTTYQEEQAMRKEVLDMLEKGICRPSNSPWAFPVVMTKKPDGSIRFCFDARRLNEITRKDSYTLPRIQDLLQQFRGAEFFTVADCASGFWQVPLSKESIPKAAFITRWGLYEFLVMPFGLCNAPATYQRLVDMVLGNMRWDRASIYVDDALIYSSTWSQHMIDLDEFLRRCIEHGISLKLSKCQFGQKEVKYLGHRINKDGHTMDPDKVKAIVDTPPPATVDELRSVLGLFGHYRQYVKGYADIAEPLLAMTRQARDVYHLKKGKPRQKARKRRVIPQVKPWQWGPEEQQAFDTLKQKLVEAPILVHPDLTGQYPFRLETDASTIGTGAVLIQSQPQGDRVVGFYSYTLKPNERGWSTTEREAYAALLAMRHFRPIISGFHFTLVTDHQALRYLKSMKDPHGRIGRWLMEMQQYDFDVDHKAGKLHVVPDALSRAPIVRAVEASDDDCGDGPESVRVCAVSGEAPTDSTEASQPSPIPVNVSEDALLPSVGLPSKSVIAAQQQQDPVMVGYITYLTNGTMSGVPEEIKPLLLDLDNYVVIRGILYHLWKIRTPNRRKEVRLQLVVPKPLRPQILAAHHDNILAGHRGVFPTFEKIRKNYFWVNMLADVYEYVQSCETCAAVKTSHYGLTTGLHPVKPAAPHQPFGMISMDFLGPLPETADGNKYILVVNDYATRYCLAFSTKTAKAEEVAKILVRHVFLEYGPPSVILSDRGRHFLNDLVAAVEQLFTVRHVFSSGYRPQTAGITERLNQTLCDLLAMYVERHQQDWDEILPYVVFAYRTLYNPTVKDVPFFLLYGYEPILPHQMFELPPHLNQSLAEEERNKVAHRLNEARKLAAATVANVQRHMQRRHDAHRREPVDYKVGDLVYTIKPQIAPGGAIAKLGKVYDGPYRIDEFLPGFRTMRLIRMRSGNNHGGETRLAHIDNVKPFRPAAATRPDTVYEVAEPVLSVEQETRVIDQLERAAQAAKATIGAPRSRAIISHALGQMDVPPLPAPVLPEPPLPHPNDARMPLPLQAPQVPQAPPVPPPIKVPLAKSWKKDDRPWHLPPAPSTAEVTGHTRSGRHVRRPQQVYMTLVDGAEPCAMVADPQDSYLNAPVVLDGGPLVQSIWESSSAL
jgi:hypothetical protein